MNPITLGIIGCGLAARDLHWPAIRELKPQFTIEVVCDKSYERAREFAELVSAKRFVVDYHDVLYASSVEAVDIALPFRLNSTVAREALLAGKHVIVEKPMAHDLVEGNKMVLLEKRYPSLVTMVAENFLYLPALAQAKAYLERGEIGIPYAVFLNHFEYLNSDFKYLSKAEWRLDRELYPAGLCADGAIHFIAALRFLFGDIVPQSSFTRSVNPSIGGLDCYCFHFRTSADIFGIFNFFISSTGYKEDRIIILGDKGTMVIEQYRKIRLLTASAEREDVFEDGFGYVAEFEDFYAAIRTGRKVGNSFADSFLDLKVNLLSLVMSRQRRVCDLG